MRQANVAAIVHHKQPRHIADLTLVDTDFTGDYVTIAQTDRLAFDRFANRHLLAAKSTLDRQERAERLANKHEN